MYVFTFNGQWTSKNNHLAGKFIFGSEFCAKGRQSHKLMVACGRPTHPKFRPNHTRIYFNLLSCCAIWTWLPSSGPDAATDQRQRWSDNESTRSKYSLFTQRIRSANRRLSPGVYLKVIIKFICTCKHTYCHERQYIHWYTSIIWVNAETKICTNKS